jgi:hypothetical protein
LGDVVIPFSEVNNVRLLLSLHHWFYLTKLSTSGAHHQHLLVHNAYFQAAACLATYTLVIMDDGYQNIIRGSPVDRKPDRAALDAAIDTETQGPRPLRWSDPAIYHRAVVRATVGPNLIKEVFDNIIAHDTNDYTPDVHPHRLHMCDPALYTTAIDVATLNGRLYIDFFDNFLSSEVVYQVVEQVVRNEHRPLAIRQSEPRGSHSARTQVLHHTHQPRVSQTPYSSSLYADSLDHQRVGRSESAQQQQQFSPLPIDTHVDRLAPDQLSSQPRMRRGQPLPEQSDAWDAIQRGRAYGAGRNRSRSPVASEQVTPSERARSYSSQTSTAQVAYPMQCDRYRDRDQTPHIDTSAPLTPEAVGEQLRRNSSQHPPRSASSHQQHATSNEIWQDNSRPIDDQVIGSANTQAVHPPHNHNDSHACDTPCHNHNRVQGDEHANTPSVSAPTAVQSSKISQVERMRQKNQYAICIDCWSGGLKCDSQAVCRGCAKANRPCTYVRCPLGDHPRGVICPAYHTWTGDDGVRYIGSSMHLMALLKMDLPPTPKYDLTIIRELFSRSDSAAEMYNRIVGELEEAALNEQEIYRDFVGKLVLKQGFACKAIRFKLDLIVEFFAEKKYVTLKQIPSPHC